MFIGPISGKRQKAPLTHFSSAWRQAEGERKRGKELYMDCLAYTRGCSEGKQTCSLTYVTRALLHVRETSGGVVTRAERRPYDLLPPLPLLIVINRSISCQSLHVFRHSNCSVSFSESFSAIWCLLVFMKGFAYFSPRCPFADIQAAFVCLPFYIVSYTETRGLYAWGEIVFICECQYLFSKWGWGDCWMIGVRKTASGLGICTMKLRHGEKSLEPKWTFLSDREALIMTFSRARSFLSSSEYGSRWKK